MDTHGPDTERVLPPTPQEGCLWEGKSLSGGRGTSSLAGHGKDLNTTPVEWYSGSPGERRQPNLTVSSVTALGHCPNTVWG